MLACILPYQLRTHLRQIFYNGGELTLSYVQLQNCSALHGAAVYTSIQGSSRLTAAFLTITDHCVDSSKDSLIASEPSPGYVTGLMFRGLSVSAPGCNVMSDVRLFGCDAPSESLPSWLDFTPRSVCGPGATCTSVATTGGFVSPSCSCDGIAPSPLIQDARLAPYTLHKIGGCITPLIAANLTRLDHQTQVALFSLSKGSELTNSQMQQDANLTLQVGGSMWNLGTLETEYPWEVGNTKPASWLHVLNSSGVVRSPLETSDVGAFATVPVRASAAGIRAGQHEASIAAVVMLPVLENYTQLAPQLVSILVRMVVTAVPVTEKCSFDAGQPLPHLSRLGWTTVLTFTARDVEGVPCLLVMAHPVSNHAAPTAPI